MTRRSRHAIARQLPNAAATTRIPGPSLVPSNSAAITASVVAQANTAADAATAAFGVRTRARATAITAAAPQNAASATHTYRKSLPVVTPRIAAKANGAAANRMETA